MNWEIFGIALASGLLSFPIATRNASLVHKYAGIFVQLVTAGSLAWITPAEHTAVVGVAVFIKHLADFAAWVIGTSVEKLLIQKEVRKIQWSRPKPPVI